MGEVYRARDSRLGRDVAIKVLPEHLAASPEDRARFQREAKAISALNHPHICVLHDVGREGETDYLVMELVEGETLAHRLTRGALPTAEVLRLGAQIADALERAHRAGVVHRDLKPGNVMLTKAGVKLMDFGLARVTRPGATELGATTATTPGGAPRSEEPITAKGTVVGTVQYMAPEQLEGRTVDARADLWALGCVLYEMATAKRAFEGATQASIISAIMRDQPREMTELAPLTPPALERVVRLCLAKDPDDRWQSAGDLRHELAWIVESGSLPVVPSSVAAERRRQEWVGWGVAAALASAAVVLTALWWHMNESRARHLTFTPLTFRPMIIYRALFAPDGRTVVLSAGVGGLTPRIYVIRPEYPEMQPISEPNIHLLSVSSKGELAVLTHVRTPRGVGTFVGTLARMPLGGGAPREIVDDVREASWTPDGTQLAVIRRVGEKDCVECPIGTVLSDSVAYPSGIRISPKGDAVAFVEHPDRHDVGGSIALLDMRGRKRVLSGGYTDVEGIAWSPRGDEVLFSAASGDSQQLQVLGVNLAGRRRYAISSAGDLQIFDVNPEGGYLVARVDSRTAMMVHKPEWREDHDLSWLDASSGGVLSSDGSLLGFTEYSSAIGDGPVMCLRRTDGSPVVKLGVGRLCGLSRDEKKVLGLVFSKPPQLVIYPTGTGDIVRLPRGALQRILIASFSPGGDSVGFLGNLPGKGEQDFIQAVSGGLPRAVTPEGTLFSMPDPGWRSVAANGFNRPWMLYPLDRGEPEPLPALTSHDLPLRWNADRHSILILDEEDPLGPIRSVDLKTGRRIPFLTALPSNRDGLVHRLVTSITPDNRCYAYDADYAVSTLYVARLGR